MSESRKEMEKRFQGTKVVPGTRNFHQFDPITETKVAVQRCSENIQYELIHDLYGKGNLEPIIVDLLDYVACIYKENWWIGIVLQKNYQDLDILITFMYPSGPTRSLYWPLNDYLCWVPETKLICKVNVPVPISGRRRKYCIDENYIHTIESKFVAVK